MSQERLINTIVDRSLLHLPSGVVDPWRAQRDELEEILFPRFVVATPAGDDRASPFRSLFHGMAAASTGRLRAADDLLTDVARADATDIVATRLASLSARLLTSVFVANRAAGEADAGSAERYLAFCEQLQEDGLRSVFATYGVLARRVADTVWLWQQQLGRLLASAGNAGFGPITALADLSGAFGSARTLLVTFSDRERRVFRPRSVAPEVAFRRVAVAINERAGEEWVRAASVDADADCGWIEHVDADSGASREGVARYYERVGLLTGVAYVLGASGIELGHVVASGERPVLVNATSLGAREVRSVLATGMVPAWRGALAERLWDDSATGGEPGAPTLASMAAVERPGTDAMRLVTVPVPVPAPFGAHQPMVDGASIDGSRHQDEMLEGFDRAATLLGKLSIPSPPGPVSLPEARSEYERIQRRLLRSAALADGAEASEAVSGLSDDGAEAMFVGEPPVVEHASVDASTIARRLDVRNWSHQRSLYQLALAARWPTPPGSMPSTSSVSPPPNATAVAHHPDLEPERLIAAAAAIGDRLLPPLEAAIATDAEWIGTRHDRVHDRYLLQTLGIDLYDGVSGVGLFYAALARLTGSDRYEQVARAAARQAVRLADDATDVGGLVGIGAAIYGLAKVGTLLDDEALLEAAWALAPTLSRVVEKAEGSTLAEMIGGEAGVLLTMLVLADLDPFVERSELRRLAEPIAERLAEARRLASPAGAAWVAFDGSLLTGLSHGTSGVALALGRAHRLLGRDDFRTAALEAIEYENGTYGATIRNWPDLRVSDGPVEPLNAWCHGAAGIRLARHAIARELDVAPSLPPGCVLPWDGAAFAADWLCCGQAGRLVAALAEPDGREHAAAMASGLVERAERDALVGGWLRGHERHASSLFMGLSGVGYSLLYTAAPDIVPNVLLLE